VAPAAATCRGVRLALQVTAVPLLVLLIGGLLWVPASGIPAVPSGPERPDVAEGEVARWSGGSHSPSKPLADPDRVRATLKVGRTYLVRAKGGFVAAGTHTDYHGRRRAVHLAYAFETTFSRTIEQNDGERIVELRRFARIWAVTLLSTEELTLDLGPPGEPLLETLQGIEPHEGIRRVVPRRVAEAILRTPAEAVVEDPAARAFWESDPLSGKTIRLAYVDGVGVESIQPVGCTLTAADCSYLFRAPVLWHGYVLSSTGSNTGDVWSVDAAELMDIIPPTMPGIPEGEILVTRDRACRQNGKQCVSLRILGPAAERPVWHSFSPTGPIQFDLRDGLSVAARLSWRASRNCLARFYRRGEHVLPKVELHEEPTVTLDYRCDVQPLTVAGTFGEDLEPALASVPGASEPAEPKPPFGTAESASLLCSGAQGSCSGEFGDIIGGILILLASSVVMFWWGMTIGCDLPPRLSRCVLLGTVVLTVVFAVGVHGTLLPAQILPFSNAIVLGNWLPLGAALLAGIVAAERAVPAWRRAAFGLILVALGWHTVLGHAPTPPSISRARFQNGISLQTSSVSCGPCCAATLLEYHGIEANEREMMELCLTNKTGTSLLGLYRGLKLKTRDTDWEVEIVRCRVEDLCRAEMCPLIVSVRLEPEPCSGSTEWGMAPLRLLRAGHTIVLLGVREDGRVEVGDPGCGNAQWDLDDLRARWSGEGLRLAERPHFL
jgi:predicted double-glycine peptidase